MTANEIAEVAVGRLAVMRAADGQPTVRTQPRAAGGGRRLTGRRLTGGWLSSYL
ncbi:MAG TPA: hypothetical protein VK586_27070 [Streptosporangiaceae bacterium]|nr:hypothetical protein [Streptosporangiaceae bacterium]